MPHRLMAIEAPCRSASAPRHGAEKTRADRPWVSLVPSASVLRTTAGQAGTRSPTSIIRRRYRGCIVDSYACTVIADICTLALCVLLPREPISIGEGLRIKCGRNSCRPLKAKKTKRPWAAFTPEGVITSTAIFQCMLCSGACAHAYFRLLCCVGVENLVRTIDARLAE